MHTLFEQMIYSNHWLWAHVMLGGIMARLFYAFYKKVSPYDKDSLSQVSIGSVLVLAILYEVFEYFFLTWTGILDAAGDIMGAFLMAIIVLI